MANRQDEVGSKNIADAVVKRLAGTAVQEGFVAASEGGANAGLTDEKVARFASGLIGAGGSAQSGEAGQWVEWVGMNLATGQADESIRNLVKGWTQKLQSAFKAMAMIPRRCQVKSAMINRIKQEQSFINIVFIGQMTLDARLFMEVRFQLVAQVKP